MTARVLFVLGTASDAGKSTIVTALCRLFARRGLRVAPFKAQNMARNAYVTTSGGEIGVAQAVQAQAAGIEPTVDMNPILLKPEPGLRSQVVVHGQSLGSMTFGTYTDRRSLMEDAVRASFSRLREAFDLVIVEGAGSPAEINLHDRDLANLGVMRMANGPAILVGDIDRGGVFASFAGTLALLPDDIRPRVRGFVINKLIGDVALLAPGLRMIEERTGVPVLGVVPHLGNVLVPDEDSLGLARYRARSRARLDELEIAVLDLPAIANHEDVLPFEADRGVLVRLVNDARDIEGADLVILPGSKSTMHDLAWLRDRGFDRALARRAERDEPILGICGGCQMLGRSIEDPDHVESDRGATEGLDLLPIRTRFMREKRTVRLELRVRSGKLFEGAEGTLAQGFHIHHGRIEPIGECMAPFDTRENGAHAWLAEGATSGIVLGTMVHGLFENAHVRAALLDTLRARRGLPPSERAPEGGRAAAYDRLADHVAAAIDLDRVHALLGDLA